MQLGRQLLARAHLPHRAEQPLLLVLVLPRRLLLRGAWVRVKGTARGRGRGRGRARVRVGLGFGPRSRAHLRGAQHLLGPLLAPLHLVELLAQLGQLALRRRQLGALVAQLGLEALVRVRVRARVRVRVRVRVTVRVRVRVRVSAGAAGLQPPLQSLLRLPPLDRVRTPALLA